MRSLLAAQSLGQASPASVARDGQRYISVNRTPTPIRRHSIPAIIHIIWSAGFSSSPYLIRRLAPDSSRLKRKHMHPQTTRDVGSRGLIIKMRAVASTPTATSTTKHAFGIVTFIFDPRMSPFQRPDHKKRLRSKSEPFQKYTRRRATLPQTNSAVPSPLRPFTSVFGMGTGVTSSLWSPGKMLWTIDLVGQ